MTQSLHQTDHQLKSAITEELEWAPDVGADHVGVSVNDGAVALSGEVQSYPEKAAALRAALRVHGVTAIADELVVKHAQGDRPDVDIARDAASAIDKNALLASGAVKANVHGHQITLTGAVEWNYQREAAKDCVAGVRGVTAIRNQVRLQPTAAFYADKAKARVDAALLRNAQLDANRVHVQACVTADGSEVELSGAVSSWAEFRQAGYAAWSTPGVTRVKNHLTVIAEARP